MVSTKLADALKTIGLNKYERNLWLALLSRGSSTAGELADISKVPRSRCYDVLESLAFKGFIIVQPSKPLRYVAIPPREALEKVKKRIQDDVVEMTRKIDRLVRSDVIKGLEKVYKEGFEKLNPEEFTGALRGKRSINHHLDNMLKKAKRHVKLITTEDGLIELAQNDATLRKLSKVGVKIHIAAPVTKKSIEAAKSMAKYAEIRNIKDAKHAAKMFANMYLVDGQEFLLGLTDERKTHPTQHISFWTQSKHVGSNAIEPLFNLVWNNSKPLK